MATLEEIKKIGILGAGQMGRGIAQIAATSGFDVVLADTSFELADRGRSKIVSTWKQLVDKQKMTPQACSESTARIASADGPEDFRACDFVIEAATENAEVKLALFRTCDSVLAPGKWLASNTSSISLTRLAAATCRPDRVIGMHFMNPPPLMKLVEIVRALQTSEPTYAATVELARKMGKTVVTTKDMPGFIVNRMLIPFINEACFALQEGLGTTEDIDQAARLGLNHPMGPLQLADLIGLDTCLFIAEVLQREFGEDKYRPSALLRNYVAAGWLGKKTNRGFYLYSEGSIERPSAHPPARP